MVPRRLRLLASSARLRICPRKRSVLKEVGKREGRREVEGGNRRPIAIE
jgi:hypothetical protein